MWIWKTTNKVDPLTGEILDEDHLINEDVVQAILITAQKAIERKILREKNKKESAGAKWTPEEDAQLIEEYKNSIISVTDRLFTNTETGKKMIEMYSEQIRYETYLAIPGKVDKRVTEGSPSRYYYQCYDEVVNLKIPEILINLNNNWNPFIYHENDASKLTNEEKGKS
jgi:hypothetical protein